MTKDVENEFGQIIGHKLENWKTPPNVIDRDDCQVLQGNHTCLKPLSPVDCDALHDVFLEANDDLWTYLPYGPCANVDEFSNIISSLRAPDSGCMPYGVYNRNGEIVGFAAYLRITPQAGSIEIGHLAFSPKLQKTTAATEAIFLMIDKAFELGYRRVEWKCNDLNLPSMNAAKRFGFTYEGTFRQALIVKGHNRDTAWFSIIDTEWSALRIKYLEWLSEQNFDDDGQQKVSLNSLIDTLIDTPKT